MGLRVKRSMGAIILLFVVLMENCFYTVDADAINVAGSIAYSDFWLVLFALYFLWKFVKHIKTKVEYQHKYLILILCFFTLIAARQQAELTGQSFMLGLRPQRNYLIILLSYFPIRKLVHLGKLDKNQLFQGFMVLGTFSGMLYIFQKLTYEHVQFIYTQTSHELGTLRMYLDTSLIQIAGLLAIYYFCKTFKIRYLIAYAINFLVIFWVGQGRLEIISYIAATVLGVLLMRKISNRRLVLLLIGMACVLVFMNTSYADKLWEAVMNAGTATSEQGNTMEIRYLGRERYFSQLSESVSTFLFGCGYPNLLYVPAAHKAGFHLKMNLNDNGIFGYAYIYGILGAAVIITVFVKMVKQAICVFKEKDNNFYLMYLALILVFAYNVIMWYWFASGTFLLILLICILEDEFQKCRDTQIHKNEGE